MNDAAKEAVSEAVDTARDVADDAVRHPWIKQLARFGFIVKGLLWVVVGILAIAAVVGVRGAHPADPHGALAILASKSYGKVFLVIFIVGAVGQGIWNILRGITDVDVLGRSVFAIIARSVQVLIGTFYIGLAASAIEIILAARVRDEPSQAEETFVAVLLAIPILGVLLTLIIGLGLVGAGFTEAFNGVSGRFHKNYKNWQISGGHLFVIKVLGAVSFSVRAVLLVIMGWFFIKAGFDGKPGGIGIDAALMTLLSSGYGRTLVGIAGVGLIGHGLIAFYEARYRRLS